MIIGVRYKDEKYKFYGWFPFLSWAKEWVKDKDINEIYLAADL